MSDLLKSIAVRLSYEPVMVVAVLLAAGAAYLGISTEELADKILALLIVAGGFVQRAKVSPVRSLDV